MLIFLIYSWFYAWETDKRYYLPPVQKSGGTCLPHPLLKLGPYTKIKECTKLI